MTYFVYLFYCTNKKNFVELETKNPQFWVYASVNMTKSAYFLRLIFEFYEYVELTKSLIISFIVWRNFTRMSTDDKFTYLTFIYVDEKIWSLRICQLDEKLTYFTFIYFMRKKCSWRKGQLTKSLYSLRLLILRKIFYSLR